MTRDRNIIENNGVPEYATYASLPPPNLYQGLALVQDTYTLYKSNGTRWEVDLNSVTSNKAYVCLGGDHPDIQYSINGSVKGGLHRIPLDRGLPWYVAVNTHTGDVMPGRDGITVTWAQLKEMQNQGVDIVSHGVGPHINSWRRTSTGVYIRYTGDSSTASLDVSGTWPAISMITTLAGDQTDGSLGFNMSLTDPLYDTIAKVAAYINTLVKWECWVDPCLSGSELSTNFLIQSATNLKPTSTSITYSSGNAVVTFAKHGAKSGDLITVTGASPSNYNVTDFKIGAIDSADVFRYPVSGNPGNATVQGKMSFRRPICAGAGLILYYTGTAYNVVKVENNGSTFRVYGDGVNILSYTLANASYDTIGKIAAAINAAGISGLSCELSDDRRTAPNVASSITSSCPYLHGSENSSNLEICYSREISSGFVRINAGLPVSYINNRRVEASVAEAANYGIKVKHFASSGSNCTFDFAPTTDVIEEVRGNTNVFTQYPLAVPIASLPPGFHVVVEPNSSYGATLVAHMTCLVDALADSPGFIIDILTHSVSVDGSSGYALTAPQTTVDLSEAQFVELCNKLIANSNKIVALTYSQLNKLKPIASKPKNYLFNPKFKNSGESLLGAVALTNTAKLPGIGLVTPAHVITASVADGRFLIETNAATSFSLLTWQIMLEPEKPYSLSCVVEFQSYTTGNLIWEVYPTQETIDHVYGGALSSITSDTQSKTGTVSMIFEVNPPIIFPATVKSKVGTYNVPTGTVKIKFAALSYLTGISLAGAIPAATTAQEVANAFNAAMATAITAGTYGEEWRNFATLENGRVVIKSPYRQRIKSSEMITIAADTGSDQLTPVFGNTLISGGGSISSESSAERFPYNVRLKVACTGKFTISNPILREVKNY